MDKRLELTEKQKEIVSRYEAIVKEMEEAKIVGVFEYFNDVFLFNGEQVENVYFEEDRSDLTVNVNTDDCYVVGVPFGLCICYDETFNVEFTESAD